MAIVCRGRMVKESHLFDFLKSKGHLYASGEGSEREKVMMLEKGDN